MSTREALIVHWFPALDKAEVHSWGDWRRLIPSRQMGSPSEPVVLPEPPPQSSVIPFGDRLPVTCHSSKMYDKRIIHFCNLERFEKSWSPSYDLQTLKRRFYKALLV